MDSVCGLFVVGCDLLLCYLRFDVCYRLGLGVALVCCCDLLVDDFDLFVCWFGYCLIWGVWFN